MHLYAINVCFMHGISHLYLDQTNRITKGARIDGQDLTGFVMQFNPYYPTDVFIFGVQNMHRKTRK